MKIYELHRKTKNNIGDYLCNPSRYFEFTNLESGEIRRNNFDITDSALIIGGGGLIHKSFNKNIIASIEKKPKVTALWGVGHNFTERHVSKAQEYPWYPKWLENCNLIGIRDYVKDRLDYYLPCVTCMHSAFDKTYNIQHDYVYYTHAYKSNLQPEQVKYPFMQNNESDMNKVIKFLGSADTVITDSYHGAYWAQLLGKKVIVKSWSVKFDYLKHPVKYITSMKTPDLPTDIQPPSDEYLEECRELNINFYHKFQDATQ